MSDKEEEKKEKKEEKVFSDDSDSEEDYVPEIKGKSLGSTSNVNEDEGAAGWVERTRKISKLQDKLKTKQMQEEARMAEKNKKALNKKNNKVDEETMAGMGLEVTHDFSKIKAGESVILTLESAPILDESGHKFAKGKDKLMNVNMRDHEIDERNKKRKQRGSKHYDPYASEEEDILGKYDDREEKLKKSFVIGKQNIPSKDQVKENLKKINGGELGMKSDALSYTAPVFGSDYLTKEETKEKTGFKKRKKKKKRGKERKKTTSVLDEIGDIDMKEGQDYGSRSNR